MKTSVGSREFQYLFAYLFVLVAIFPVVLMIGSSFKTNAEIFANPLGLPKEFSLAPYAKLWDSVPFDDFLLNSVIVSIVSVVLILLTASMAAFYIARFPFKWNGVLYFFFLLGLMIPIKLGIVPLFLLMKKLGLLNSLLSLIFIYTARGIPISVFILTGFFRTLPVSWRKRRGSTGATTSRCFGRFSCR